MEFREITWENFIECIEFIGNRRTETVYLI